MGLWRLFSSFEIPCLPLKELSLDDCCAHCYLFVLYSFTHSFAKHLWSTLFIDAPYQVVKKNEPLVRCVSSENSCIGLFYFNFFFKGMTAKNVTKSWLVFSITWSLVLARTKFQRRINVLNSSFNHNLAPFWLFLIYSLKWSLQPCLKISDYIKYCFIYCFI